MADLHVNADRLNVFKATFKNKDVRSIFIDDVRFFNVTDFLKLLVAPQTCGTVWKRLRNEHDTIAAAAKKHAFAGGPPTPVVPIETLVEMMLHMPGRTSDDVKWACARLFVMQFNPDPKLVAMIDDGLHASGKEAPEDSILYLPSTSTKSRGAYDQTMGYIRIRLPEEHVVDNTTSKEISTGVIKFGIAYSLRDRDVKYSDDNGFMAYSYNFLNRWEASMVEQILRYEFRDITCYDSKEYLNADALAKRLGYAEYSADSYTSYAELARRLFARMVSIAKLNFPENYRELHGFVYEIDVREVKPSQTIIAPDGSIDRPASQMEYKFPCKAISNAMASELGLVDPITKLTKQLADVKAELKSVVNNNVAATAQVPITKLTNDLADVKAELERVKNNNVTATGPVPIVPPQSEEMPPQQPGKPRSHGVVIGRDLRTGEDLRYASAERAANACGMTAASFRRSVMNRRRQLNGCHWRSEGLAIWVPPTGFCYDGQFDSQSTNLMFVVADKAQGSSGDTENQRKIFESITAAARIMNLDRRKLSDIVAHQREYGGYVWSTLDMEKCGTMIEDADAPVPVPNAALDAGISLRCAGRVIARDLATGAEKVYDSVTRAAAMSGMSALTMREQLLDKPRQGFGRVFRSFVSTTRWEPPENLVFDPKKYVKTSGYVKSVDKDGNVKLYESIWEATSILGLHKSAVQQCIDTGKVSSKLGLLWYRAEEKDFMNMVPCEPPSASKS
jgi:hypothetical protein